METAAFSRVMHTQQPSNSRLASNFTTAQPHRNSSRQYAGASRQLLHKHYWMRAPAHNTKVTMSSTLKPMTVSKKEHVQTKDMQSIVFTQEQIKQKVSELGARISSDYEGKNPVVVGVLTGSFIFLADLSREITVPHVVDLMKTSSYGSGTTTSGKVEIQLETSTDLKGRHVIIVEDIIDTGLTLNKLYQAISAKQPASIQICAFCDKIARRVEHVDAKYIGYECPDEFVVGYGLDFAGEYRSLPYVGILKPEVITGKSQL